MSHVKVSFDTPEYTANADGIGTLRILEAVRLLGMEKKTKIYQASTSELYGLVQAAMAFFREATKALKLIGFRRNDVPVRVVLLPWYRTIKVG